APSRIGPRTWLRTLPPGQHRFTKKTVLRANMIQGRILPLLLLAFGAVAGTWLSASILCSQRLAQTLFLPLSTLSAKTPWAHSDQHACRLTGTSPLKYAICQVALLDARPTSDHTFFHASCT
ncbi:MAG: hypothetical protein MK161_14285, partial [Pirellulales bacterium]|nr:hypothetical protein [Pirellulales bacterium]